MLHRSNFIENEIRNAIRAKFPLLAHKIYNDKSRDEYVVAVYDKDTYYSEAYRELVMELKIDSLWPADINNVYFVVEDDPSNSMEHGSISIMDCDSVAQTFNMNGHVPGAHR